MPNRTLTHGYEDYLDEGGHLTYSLYRKVCALYNQRVMDRIIEHAEVFKLGYKMSIIKVVWNNQHKDAFPIDWFASHKLKEEIIERGGTPQDKDEAPDGEKWLITYDLDKPYARFYWKKVQCTVKNKTVYKFSPTRGLKGNKERLTKRIKNSPSSIFDYDQR